MKFTLKTDAEKLEKDELVVFCSTGVSLEPPAGLVVATGVLKSSIVFNNTNLT